MDLTELKRTIVLCKESITSASDDLTKLTGRNFDKPIDGPRQYNNSSAMDNNQRNPAKRRANYDNEVEIKRTRIDVDAPVLNSVVQMTKGRTRNDAIHDLQTKENPKEKERCKRLFGHLMGTLNSIKQESEKCTNDPQQITRMKIEKKVEEDHKLISETIKREQNELIKAKKDRQNDLKTLNQRYRAAEAFERWRIEKEKMKGYIRTSKAPFIFYKPKYINEESQLRLDKTAREIDLLIETRKKKLESEIERVVKRHLEGSGIKQEDGTELDNIKINATFIGSTVSVVSNNVNNNGRERSKSVANSFASEDYDDMVEEIEITMHDDPVAVHDDERHVILVSNDSDNVIATVDIDSISADLHEGECFINGNDKTIKAEGTPSEEERHLLTEGDETMDVEENDANTAKEKENTKEEKDNTMQEKDNTMQEKENLIEETENTMETEERTKKEKENAIEETENAIEETENTMETDEITTEEKGNNVNSNEGDEEIKLTPEIPDSSRE